jgi:hypothetical protein
MVGAAEAFRLGLVNRVVPDDQLMVSAEELAEQIPQNSQQAIRSAKETILDIIGRIPVLRSVSQPNIRDSLQSELRTTAWFGLPARCASRQPRMPMWSASKMIHSIIKKGKQGIL